MSATTNDLTSSHDIRTTLKSIQQEPLEASGTTTNLTSATTTKPALCTPNADGGAQSGCSEEEGRGGFVQAVREEAAKQLEGSSRAGGGGRDDVSGQTQVEGREGLQEATHWPSGSVLLRLGPSRLGICHRSYIFSTFTFTNFIRSPRNICVGPPLPAGISYRSSCLTTCFRPPD